MNFEKNFSSTENKIEDYNIVIKKSKDAPSNIKRNPFYDEELWGRALSPDDIYVPDSDEVLSFAVAAHEIGHLIEEGKRLDASLDNFDATFEEEERAWDKGWKYLLCSMEDYFNDRAEDMQRVIKSFEKIKSLYLEATKLGEGMYLEKGSLDKLNSEEIQKILEEKREVFFREKGDEFESLFKEMKAEKIGIKTDWDKLTKQVKDAVRRILEDNEEFKKQL